MNSKDYWDERFKTGNWESNQGKEQNKFFYKIAIENLPKWIKQEINGKRLNICDMGSAQGDGTEIIRQNFSNSEIFGVDFSESATETAQNSYPGIRFICSDIQDYSQSHDIIFSSNTIEHFQNPNIIIKHLLNLSSQYLILLLPFQEKDLDKEHFTSFDYYSFHINDNRHQLIFYKEIDTKNLKNTYWLGKQILVIYANTETIDIKRFTLEHLNNHYFELYLNKKEENIVLEEIKEKKTVLENQLVNMENELLESQNKLFEAQNKFFKAQNELNNQNNIIIGEKRKYNTIKKELDLIHKSDFWKLALKYYHIRDHVWPFSAVFNYIKRKKLKKVKQRKKLGSLKHKALQGNINRDGSKHDIIFFSIINYDYKYHQRPQHIADFFSEKGHQVHYINTYFSKNGTQVLEVNKNLRMVNLSSEERFITLTNFSNPHDEIYKELDDYIAAYNITDCVVFIEFPNWVYLGKYLKEKYGFKVVFDVLDEFEGFHPDDPVLLQSFEDLFNTSDLVITTSEFLYEKCAQLHDNVKIVRNGVEFKHFNHYYTKNGSDNVRPTIGYYGALADWFDFDKVEYVAKKRPEYDIVLIGDTKDSDEINIERLKNLSNVKLLGAKDYNELPYYLRTFDVALIPFKQDQELIKATNPVKFYEYLSMGKKIVATEIPELMDYKDIFVYLTNNKDVFLDYIDKCVNSEDDLAAAEKCIDFARTQDWENRINDIKKHIIQMFNLASIIMVTFNNLRCTQRCLESIFKKTAYPKYEIIIVDNKSTDNTRRYLLKLQDKHDNIKIILNEENLGFAKANNIGVSEISGDYVIILNNDTIVTHGWLSGLIKHLDRNATLGLLGPVTNSISNQAKINVDYTKIEDMENFATKYRNTHINELYTKINVLAMFCLALRKEVYEDIGPLDENFTVGMFEDDDYSYRAIKKGYQIACAEDVFIHHYGGASFFKLENNEYMKIFEKNKAIFENKWKIKWSPHSTRK